MCTEKKLKCFRSAEDAKNFTVKQRKRDITKKISLTAITNQGAQLQVKNRRSFGVN
jgi:hypothetical protein